MGMNQAGVIWLSPMSARENQALRMTAVRARWPTAPTHQATRAAVGTRSCPAVASTSSPMVIVGTKVIRIGCTSSAVAAAGNRTHLAT